MTLLRQIYQATQEVLKLFVIFLLLLSAVDLQLLFRHFNQVIGILAGQVPWLSSYSVQARGARVQHPISQSAYFGRDMTEKGMKTHHQLHEPRTTMQRGNILTFSLETYLIDFLKQTRTNEVFNFKFKYYVLPFSKSSTL